MANKLLTELLELPRPDTITQDELKFYLDQLNIFEPSTKEFSKIKKTFTDLGFKIPDNYLGVVISNWYENFTEIPKYEAQNQTTISEKGNEEIFEEAEKRAKSEKEAWENAKREVDRARQRLEEIQLEKDKKLHVKVTSKEEVKFTEDEQKVYENYKEYSKQNPQQAVEELSQEIKNRVGEDLKTQGFTNEEIEVTTSETATQLVENFTQSDDPNYIPPTHHTAVLANIAKNNQLAGKDVSESASSVANEHLLQYQMYKDITKSAFGENFANKVFGVDADKLDVSFSETPQTGGMVFTPYEVVRSNQSILEERSQTLDTVREFGVGKAKGILLNRAGSVLEKRIALLTPQSAAGKLLQSVEAKSLLFSTFGVGAPIKWEATNLIGRLALKSGYAPVVSAFGKLTGINTGLTGSISTGVKVAGQATGQTVGKVAAKTGIKAAISTTLASVGISIPVPILNFIAAAVGWLVGEVFGKLIEKYGPQIKKFFKEVLGPLLLVGGGIMFGAPVLGLAAGGLAFGFARGATLAGIGAGIWGFFGAIGSAFVMTIATPIIITLLVLPPLVAFIMLVINTGAYLVPPDPKSMGLNIDNPYMLVTKKADPDTMGNFSGTATVTYTVTITALKTTLTNLEITETKCTVSKKNASSVQNCPDGLENIPDLPADLTVSPSSPYSFTFTSDFDGSYADSSIFDSIKIKGDTEEKKDIETSGSESVCIGDCPHGCFVISDNNEKWPSNFGSTLDQATQELTSKFPNFVDKACSSGEDLNLCYTTKDPSPMGSGGLCNNAIYARHIHTNTCDINFNQCGLSNSTDAFFLLTHEITHHVQKIDGSIMDKYRSAGAPNELPLCSYSGTDPANYDNPSDADYEGSAEANALYANGGVASFSTCSMDFKQQYPKNYNFANDYMNNP